MGIGFCHSLVDMRASACTRVGMCAHIDEIFTTVHSFNLTNYCMLVNINLVKHSTNVLQVDFYT